MQVANKGLSFMKTKETPNLLNKKLYSDLKEIHDISEMLSQIVTFELHMKASSGS